MIQAARHNVLSTAYKRNTGKKENEGKNLTDIHIHR